MISPLLYCLCYIATIYVSAEDGSLYKLSRSVAEYKQWCLFYNWNISIPKRDKTALCGKQCNHQSNCIYFSVDETSTCVHCVLDTVHIQPDFVAQPNQHLNNDATVFIKTCSDLGLHYDKSYTVYAWGNAQLYHMTFYFKTYALDGVMMYSPGSAIGPADFVGAYLQNGFVYQKFNNGRSAIAVGKTVKRYNDGQWHKIILEKNKWNLYLTVDSEYITGYSGTTKTYHAHLINKLYLGGLPDTMISNAQNDMGESSLFKGCIRHEQITRENGSPIPQSDGYNSVKCTLC